MTDAMIAENEIKTMSSIELAERKAEETLQRLGVVQIPVNPIAIAQALGFSVNAAVFRDAEVSGRTLVRNGEVRIDVKSSDSPSRRRFTIAHEIGHALLHLEGIENGEIRDSEFRRQAFKEVRPAREAEADRFAAALVMPKEQVLKAAGTPPNVAALAGQFNVSAEAMKIRLEHLGLL